MDEDQLPWVTTSSTFAPFFMAAVEPIARAFGSLVPGGKCISLERLDMCLLMRSDPIGLSRSRTSRIKGLY